MNSIGLLAKGHNAMTTQSELFDNMKKLAFTIEHFENQRRNTFNLDEREKYTVQIKNLNDQIDIFLDQYNHSKKFKQLTEST